MPLIVDASVAFKWFVPEVAGERALALLDGADELMAPDLVLVEVINALWSRLRGRENFQQIVSDAASALPRMLDTISPSGELVPRALEMTIDLNHPLYDCIYLALAERTQAPLVTADLGFYRKLADSAYAALARKLEDVAS